MRSLLDMTPRVCEESPVKFGLDRDKLLAYFSLGDGDLALAFAEMEGFVARGRGDRAVWQKDALPVVFGSASKDGEYQGAAPFQLTPGLFAYRLRRIRQKDLLERDVEVAKPRRRIMQLKNRLLEIVVREPGRNTAHYARAMEIDTGAASNLLCALRHTGHLSSREQPATDLRQRRCWIPTNLALLVTAKGEPPPPVSTVRPHMVRRDPVNAMG